MAAYADNVADTQTSAQYLERILIQETRDVLIVDDHDQFNMTITLAAMRGSFDGIWSARYDALEVNPKERIREYVNTNFEHARDFIREHGRSDRACTVCLQSRAFPWTTKLRHELNDTTTPEDYWQRYDLNFCANQLDSKCPLDVPTKLIWLTFPYLKYASRVAPYIRKFLYDCSKRQEIGDVVLISLLGKNPYNGFDRDYRLEDLLPLATRLGYEHSVEPTFVKRYCMHYGFHHRTYKRKYDNEDESDMNWVAVPFSEVHVFVKERDADAGVSITELKAESLSTTAPRPERPIERRAIVNAPVTPPCTPPPPRPRTPIRLLTPPREPQTPPRSPLKRALEGAAEPETPTTKRKKTLDEMIATIERMVVDHKKWMDDFEKRMDRLQGR